ncbi:MAG: hypothetical protein OK441_01645 [Thaumarchaeota archaeon]|nr:hypothetical protein [Nitrososphaerota archaeon]
MDVVGDVTELEAADEVGEVTELLVEAAVRAPSPAMKEPAAAITMIARTIVAPREVEMPLRRPWDIVFILLPTME